MRYRLTRRAEEDIIEIYLAGIAGFGETQAEKYHAGLVRAFDFIASNPLAARERREVSPPVRLHIHGAHVIAYLARTSDVLVIRILHGRRDWQRHLS
jgi:toxin ParE1/3/4